MESDLFRAISTVAGRHDPGVPIVPMVSTGFTDSHYFMELGMSCFGFAPFRFTEEERQRVHGNDERLSTENLRNGTRFIYELLQEISSSDR
jgi:acetylornithine deacetylase/succinyl-diaminopimelate desuccinylase-like protein